MIDLLLFVVGGLLMLFGFVYGLALLSVGVIYAFSHYWPAR